MWNDLLRALSLVFVIEGILPFVAPARARGVYLRLAQSDDRLVRLVGLGSMIAGLAALQFVRFFA